MGSNFADYDKYSAGALSTYNLLPKKDSPTLGGPWNIDKIGATWD